MFQATTARVTSCDIRYLGIKQKLKIPIVMQIEKRGLKIKACTHLGQALIN